jgi:phosphonate transport system permease protein
VRYAALPQVLPNIASYTLLRFEINVRASSIVGFVGAGGIGFELMSAMSLFQYQLVSLLLIVTFVIVITAERLSALLRARLG